MHDDSGKTGWSGYRPSKALWFWSCAGTAVATMVLGFTWGGWVTGGSAEYQAAAAREAGRAKLAAAICVERFLGQPDARVQLTALKDESSWGRDDMIADGGWTTPVGLEEPIEGAADLCAEQLADFEMPAEETMLEEASAEVPAAEAN